MRVKGLITKDETGVQTSVYREKHQVYLLIFTVSHPSVTK